MEARTLQAFLRILYTVNNNPQYILAKSSSQVSVVACGEVTAQSATDKPAYARAPLKACLAVVCDSSPELLQDLTRDFTLYFLDPLEAQPLPTGLANAAHNTNSPRGVAVALGLMSWALESNDSANVYVTGTIVPSVSPALEVVCALRETKRMPKPMLHSYPPLGSVLASGPHPLTPPQTSEFSLSSTFYSQYNQPQQQTLTRSADFPELYIGPPRRGRGRPEGSASSKSKVKAHANALALPGASSAAVESKQGAKKGPEQKAKPRPPRPPPTHSPFICAPLIRVAGSGVRATHVPANDERSHPSDGQNRQHAELHRRAQPHSSSLLELISAISSTTGESGGNPTPEQQAALISALQGLIAANSYLLQPITTSEGLPVDSGGTTTQDVPESSNAGSEHGDGDSDIVILDSSTIDTTVFRKSSTKHQTTADHDASPLAIHQESPMPSNEGMDSSPLPASTPSSVQENISVLPQASTPSDALESTSTVTADRKTPKYDSLGWTGRANRNTSRPLEIPATPTPSRTRKRKLDKYIQSQAHWSTPTSPPSPSPSMTRMSSSGRAMNTRRGGQWSPTGRTISSPSIRLPSMLASMRGTAALGSRMQRISAEPSMHGHSASREAENNGNQPTLLLEPKAEHDTTSDASSLKRRRTLSEFMEEHEARKNTKAREQLSARKLGTDMSVNASSHRALPRPIEVGSTLRHAQSSPPRPLFRSALQLPTSISKPGVMPSMDISNPASAPTTTVASTGPSSTTTQTKNPLKGFVMPAWARTSTALLPRLSKEALARQQAERETKKVQAALRRRETAKAKRKQLHADRPSRDSSDENDGTTTSVARSAPVSQPPLPTLPVFASDAVAPIASSPPPMHNQPVLPAVPSTPPKKPISLSGSALHRTPTKSGSCSLFTPSGQDGLSLFTPSTPSVTQSQTGANFTLRSPTLLRRSGGTKKSPRKSVIQTPRTPRRNASDHPTPNSLGGNRHLPSRSPSMATRMPRTQTGMGTRAFLLPPPSPCVPRTPQRSKRESVGTTPTALRELGPLRQMPALGMHMECAQRMDEDMLGRELEDAFLLEGAMVSPTRRHPSRENSKSDDIDVGSDAAAEENYASSPLPPSSPLPASPPSSPGPAKHDGGVHLTSAENTTQRTAEVAQLLSDDGADPAMWFTDSEAGAWFTETEAWLTDTEGGPLPTDSDGAWLSDSDAVSTAFGRLGNSLSNWLSDEADVEETDAKVAVFDTTAFERAYAALVDAGGANVGMDGASSGEAVAGTAATYGNSTKGAIEPDFWESIQPLLEEGGATLNGAESVSEVAHDMQELLDGLVDT